MSGLFGKAPEPVTPPPVPEPPPVPQVSDETEDIAAKSVRRAAGFQKSAFLTGNLTPKSTGKKTTFG